MRKKLALAAVVVALVSLVAYGTMAYLTADYTAHNVIQAGTLDIVLLDKTLPEEGAEDLPLAEYPDFPAEGLPMMPGTSADKLVAVQLAEGSADAWVRVRLAETIQMREEETPRPLDGDPISLELDLVNWLPGKTESGAWDGWYYYAKPLTQDEPLTTLLLSQVHFDGPEMGNEHQGSVYRLTAVAQAVQFANNPAPQGGNVTDVPGWPAID